VEAFEGSAPIKHEAGTSPEKRERILRAAIEAFSAQGYYHTRIRDIAQAAGIADGTVYLYFKNKEALLTAIFEDVMDRALEEGRRRINAPGRAVDRLRRLVDLQLSSLGGDRDLATVFQIELRHTGSGMARYRRSHMSDYLGLFEEVLKAGQADGSLREDLDIEFTSRSIFGVIDAAALEWVVNRSEARLEDQLDAVVDLLMRGLSAAGHPQQS